MIIVDTHCHASPYWFEPVETLLSHMNANHVDKAALIQFVAQYDNRYIIECARRFPGRFAPVVAVDTQRGDAPKVLEKWVKEGAGGVRLTITHRSPGKDPLAIWRKCAELRLPISCQGDKKAEEYAADEFRRLVKEFPDAPFLIEHLGHPSKDEAPPYTVYRKILALSRYPNTYIKVGGLGEICYRPYPFRQPLPFDKVPPFIRMAYDSFGPSRMMWSSDSPPSSYREGYGNTISFVAEHLKSFCSEDDKEWIFGKTALSVFRFQEKS